MSSSTAPSIELGEITYIQEISDMTISITDSKIFIQSALQQHPTKCGWQ